MLKKSENNGTEEIVLVTLTPGLQKIWNCKTEVTFRGLRLGPNFKHCIYEYLYVIVYIFQQNTVTKNIFAHKIGKSRLKSISPPPTRSMTSHLKGMHHVFLYYFEPHNLEASLLTKGHKPVKNISIVVSDLFEAGPKISSSLHWR